MNQKFSKYILIKLLNVFFVDLQNFDFINDFPHQNCPNNHNRQNKKVA